MPENIPAGVSTLPENIPAGVSPLLEEMSQFFASRLDGFDEHMRKIEGADEFYRFTAEQLPREPESTVLDLGCGTGLELEEYQKINPAAHITGIDLSAELLAELEKKFPGKKLELIQGSYFDVPLGINRFTAAVSVESLHHFKPERKLNLYKKLHAALAENGFFILTDYFAESVEREAEYFAILERMKAEQNLPDDRFYHYDTPLTVEHEIEILREAGFRKVEILRSWAATYTVRAEA